MLVFEALCGADADGIDELVPTAEVPRRTTAHLGAATRRRRGRGARGDAPNHRAESGWAFEGVERESRVGKRG